MSTVSPKKPWGTDAIVIDFGLPVQITSPTVTDENGKSSNEVVAVKPGSALPGVADNTKLAFSTTKAESQYGTMTIVGGKLVYTPKNMKMPESDTFVYAIKVGNAYYYSTVTVIPATTIYYEDSFVDFKVYTEKGGLQKNDGYWTAVTGQNGGNGYQDEDRPGMKDVLEDADSIYGYDTHYTNMTQYSMGSARKATISTGKSAVAEFTFKGTGFDIISLTSGRTGTILVSVYKADEYKKHAFGEAESVKNFMVDTYYGYTYDAVNKKWNVDTKAENALYQVPVMKVENLPYGEYTAVIVASYLSAFDHQNNGSYDFYLDAIRIYDPANDGANANDSIVKDAYLKDEEGWPNYYELRNQLITAGKFNSLEENGVAGGIIFIDGNPNLSAEAGSNKPGSPFGDDPTSTRPGIVDYAHFGPNNELYLAPGQAVAFNMNFTGDVKSVHLAYKTVGGTAKVKVYNGELNAADVTASTLNTATDLYYDITALNGKTVVIYNAGNSGDAILSITNIKVTYTSDPGAVPTGAVFTMTRRTAMLALASLSDTQPDDDTTSENEKPESSVPGGSSTEDKVPETGDHSAWLMRIAMLASIVAVLGCGVVIFAYRRERG